MKVARLPAETADTIDVPKSDMKATQEQDDKELNTIAELSPSGKQAPNFFEKVDSKVIATQSNGVAQELRKPVNEVEKEADDSSQSPTSRSDYFDLLTSEIHQKIKEESS